MKKYLVLTGLIGFVYLFLNGAFIGTTPPKRAPEKVQNSPTQKDLVGLTTKKTDNGKLRFVAEYEITARIFSKKLYAEYPKTHIPFDFAMGWGPVAEREVFEKIEVTQHKRFAYPAFKKPLTIPTEEFNQHFSNTHIIPANNAIYNKLKTLQNGQLVTLKGYLVNYKEGTRRAWIEFKSSKTRTDEGDGACEVMYVEHIVAY